MEIFLEQQLCRATGKHFQFKTAKLNIHLRILATNLVSQPYRKVLIQFSTMNTPNSFPKVAISNFLNV